MFKSSWATNPKDDSDNDDISVGTSEEELVSNPDDVDYHEGISLSEGEEDIDYDALPDPVAEKKAKAPNPAPVRKIYEKKTVEYAPALKASTQMKPTKVQEIPVAATKSAPKKSLPPKPNNLNKAKK